MEYHHRPFSSVQVRATTIVITAATVTSGASVSAKETVPSDNATPAKMTAAPRSGTVIRRDETSYNATKPSETARSGNSTRRSASAAQPKGGGRSETIANATAIATLATACLAPTIGAHASSPTALTGPEQRRGTTNCTHRMCRMYPFVRLAAALSTHPLSDVTPWRPFNS